MKKILLGYVGVDSGQLLICDPGYIDSEWENEKMVDERIYQHKVTKDKLQYKVDFSHYMQPIEKYGDKTMNDLNATDEWVELPKKTAKHNFSYDACCDATLSHEGYGQLCFKLGHKGIGVVFASGYGDGFYPVYGYFNKDSRIVKVEVIMK